MADVFGPVPAKILWVLGATAACITIIGLEAAKVVRARVVSAARWAWKSVLGFAVLSWLVFLALEGWGGMARWLFVLFRWALRRIVRMDMRLVRFLVGAGMRVGEQAEFDVERGEGGGEICSAGIGRWESVPLRDDMEGGGGWRGEYRP